MYVAANQNKFNSTRLVLARKRRGLTKIDLASATGVNTKRLYTFESGKAEPTAAELNAVAVALKFPEGFFFRPNVELPPVGAASFRSMKSMTASERDAALAAGTIACELSGWIDEEFHLPDPNLLDLRGDFHTPAAAANSIRAYWKIGERSIASVIRLLEANGVRVFSLTEQSRRLDAFSLWQGDQPFVFLNTIKTGEHGRMDAAHELGHLLMHRNGVPRGRDVEMDAKEFGGIFMMPEDSVRAVVRRQTSLTLQQLVGLKKHWGVSVAALAYRLHGLELLSDWNYRSICIQLSEYGRNREPESLPREESPLLQKVFAEMWKSGVTKSAIAKRLHIYESDLNAVTFGLSSMPEKPPSTDEEAKGMRSGFSVV